MSDRTKESSVTLSMDEMYRVPIKITFEDHDEGIKMVYGDCGSHAIEATGRVRLTEARRLRDYLNTLPGIDSDDD